MDAHYKTCLQMCEDSEKHLFTTLDDQTKTIANNKLELSEDLKTRQSDM